MFARLACWLVGHQWSWTYAVSVGITDAAVCRHCKRVYRA